MQAFPDSTYSELWSMSDASGRGEVIVEGVEEIDGRRLGAGELVPAEAIAFRHCSGRRVYDLVCTTWCPSLYLVSERLVSVLRQHRFTGWHTFAVRVLDGPASEMPLHGLAVTGRAATPDWQRSPRLTHLPAVPGGPRYETYVGLYFTGNRWQATDLFFPEGTCFMVVRDTVATAIREAGLTNISLTRLDQFTREWES